jgi:hypothetical protein
MNHRASGKPWSALVVLCFAAVMTVVSGPGQPAVAQQAESEAEREAVTVTASRDGRFGVKSCNGPR